MTKQEAIYWIKRAACDLDDARKLLEQDVTSTALSKLRETQQQLARASARLEELVLAA